MNQAILGAAIVAMLLSGANTFLLLNMGAKMKEMKDQVDGFKSKLPAQPSVNLADTTGETPTDPGTGNQLAERIAAQVIKLMEQKMGAGPMPAATPGNQMGSTAVPGTETDHSQSVPPTPPGRPGLPFPGPRSNQR